MSAQLNKKLTKPFRTPLIDPFFSYKIPYLSKKGVIKKLIEKRLVTKTGEGLYSYSGIINELMESLDLAFRNIFREFTRDDISFPATITYEALEKAGYFRDFRNIVEHISVMDKQSIDNRRNHKIKPKLITQKALLPAACLPWFSILKHRTFSKGVVSVTTRNKVFRNEIKYPDIFRMNEFDLREIIFLGSDQEVKRALERGTEIIKSFIKKCKITFQLKRASDIFFQGQSKEKAFYQLFAGSKIELNAYCSDLNKYLPIGSINYHGNHFGKAFKICFKDKWAHSGCIGFGLQRWALIFLNFHGLNKRKWPRYK